MPDWIRGVNVGGWLLAERFITPYLFAITSCHLKGDFCFYPGQLSAPPTENKHHKYCDMYQCEPHIIDSNLGGQEFPIDEYTLTKSFPSKALAKEYLTFHWDNFVTKQDVKEMKDARVTHIRVPVPHWIMGDIKDDEPWVDGQWLYFVRFVGWCREYGLQVWPDIHTAPGSQNGFDNSGQLLPDYPTCKNWSESEENVKRSLQAVKDIAEAIVRDNLKDVVTGFGILNEPFQDCDINVVKSFNNDALQVVRNAMGDGTAVFIGDMFNASIWNNGWWTDEDNYSNTYLDSHYYHVFAEKPRALSPKQHIAFVCAKNTRDTNACCYEDHPKNTNPSKGISRMIGEWSASFDTLPVKKLDDVMKGIQEKYEAPEFDRIISKERQAFLRNYVEAQMVSWESQNVGVSLAWFYWTMKMEGGAFAEWDFLRGVREGWIPTIPHPNNTSESVYGSCHDIADKTKDDDSIVHEFPNPLHLDDTIWMGLDITDDFVVSHAGSLNKEGTTTTTKSALDDDNKKMSVDEDDLSDDDDDKGTNRMPEDKTEPDVDAEPQQKSWFPLFALAFFCYAIWHVFFKHGGGPNFRPQRYQYTNLDAPTQLSV